MLPNLPPEPYKQDHHNTDKSPTEGMTITTDTNDYKNWDRTNHYKRAVVVQAENQPGGAYWHDTSSSH